MEALTAVFCQETAILCIIYIYIYIYIYMKIIKTIFDFDHIDEYIDKNQLNEIRVLYRFL